MTTVTFVSFDLTLAEPGGVLVHAPLPDTAGPASSGEQAEPDLVPDFDVDRRPYIPGTSLAGALRAAAGPRADAWFGHLIPDAKPTEEAGVASPIWVYGARLRGQPPAQEHRVATAIDRRRGAARTHTLRTETVLGTGTSFRAVLRWDDAPPADRAALLELLAAWHPTLGRGVSRGHGCCTIDAIRHGTLDLTEPADLLRWLTMSGPELAADVAAEPYTPSGTSTGSVAPVVTLQLRVIGPLRVGNGQQHPTDDGSQAAAIIGGDTPFIPGSSLKGVVRSRCEFILRSLGADPCLDQRCGHCLTCRLFGFGGGKDGRDSIGARGRFRFPDSPIHDAKLRSRTHVAIDRFTGGAAWQTPDPDAAARPDHEPAGQGLLYTVDAVETGTFRLVVHDLGADPDDLADFRALLRLVANDLNDRLIGIGGHTARGYGSVELTAHTGLPDTSTARARLATIMQRTPQPEAAHA